MPVQTCRRYLPVSFHLHVPKHLLGFLIGSAQCLVFPSFLSASWKNLQHPNRCRRQKQTDIKSRRTTNYNNNRDFIIKRLTIERLCSSPAAGLTCSLLFIFSLLYCVTPSPHTSSCTPSTAAQEMGQSDDQEEQGTLCCGMMKQVSCD